MGLCVLKGLLIGFDRQRIPTRIPGCAAQLPFDPKKLVILRYAIRTSRSASLDLPRIEGNRQVGNGGIFGFAGTMGGHGAPPGPLAEFDRFDGFCQLPNLVYLDKQSVASFFLNPTLHPGWVGHQQIIANNLYPVANLPLH